MKTLTLSRIEINKKWGNAKFLALLSTSAFGCGIATLIPKTPHVSYKKIHRAYSQLNSQNRLAHIKIGRTKVQRNFSM
jgi:hypothetical protein